MIMLDLPKDQMIRLEQASQQAGLTINDYIVSLINKHTKPSVDIPTKEPTLFDKAMAYKGIDVSDIEMETPPKIASKNRFMEFD